MKFKYEELEKVVNRLTKHSQKGEIDIYIDSATKALVFSYNSNVDTQTKIYIYPSDLNIIPVIEEKLWLK